MMRCKNCGRTVWEQHSGIPGRPETGIYFHHHNWNMLCFPTQKAEVDDDNPCQSYLVEPEPESAMAKK
jgi:hypothetical protein